MWHRSLLANEVVRYGLNGLFATAVHYGLLVFNVHILNMSSAGIANLLAAIAGICTSFLGSRFFVFNAVKQPVLGQAMRFGGLYAGIAILHGLTLYVWSDLNAYDYRSGFLFATFLQIVLSYFGNKKLVFK